MAKPKDRGPVSVKFGKGVMSKDGRTPFAAGTLHYTSTSGYMSPALLTFKNVGILLTDPTVTEIQIIDEENNQITIKTGVPDDPELREQTRQSIMAELPPMTPDIHVKPRRTSRGKR